MKIQNFQSHQRDLIRDFHGFLVGASEDAVVYNNKKKYEYIVEIDQKSYEWLKTVQHAVQKEFNKLITVRKTSKGYYRITIFSKDFFKEIKKHRENSAWILNKPEAFQLGFLQGMFDAEGSIKKDRNHVTISSNREDLIKTVQTLLSKFGFRLGKTWKDKNNVITLPFYGKDNLQKFQELINFRHPEKEKRLVYHLQDPYNGVVVGESSY